VLIRIAESPRTSDANIWRSALTPQFSAHDLTTGFAHPLFILIGNSSLIRGSYEESQVITVMQNLAQQVGAEFIWLRFDLDEPGLKQLVGAAGIVGTAEAALDSHDPSVQGLLVPVDGNGAFEIAEGLFGVATL
jgi:hypothetical protein